jgi:hypothetical protein
VTGSSSPSSIEGGSSSKRASVALMAAAPLRRRFTRLFVHLGAALALSAAGCASRSLPAQSAAGAPTSTPPPSQPPSRHNERTFGWLSVAVGAEAAVLAVVTSGMMLHEKSVRDGNCDAQKVCTQPGFDANRTLGSLGGWNAAAWIVAAAGLGVGGFLLWKDPADGGQHAAIIVAPTGSAVSLGVRSRF